MIGIDDDIRETLFDAFTQADASTTRRFGGTGLGLAITREIVDALGGTLEFESVPAVGSRFWFTVPVETVRRDTGPSATSQPHLDSTFVPLGRSDIERTDSAATRRRPAWATPISVAKPPRVLIVDDNRINRRVLAKLLDTMGCIVEQAGDGKEALELLDDNAGVDLILMDCQMPVMDGYEATQKIRGMDGEIARTPIVAVTAGGQIEDRDRALASGMDHWLPKPVQREDLRATVRRFVPG